VQELNEEIYPVFTGPEGLEQLGQAFHRKEYHEVYVLVDEHTAEFCLPLLEAYTGPLKIIRIKSGEENKSLETCGEIWGMLLQSQADRKMLLLNLGGGVITDIGGFCAALYKRGVSFINIPTTLLAMVDASIGSKTGINFLGIKNTIGCFKSPLAVYIYTPFLETLPEREYLAAFAEICKHALVADRHYWDKLKLMHPSEDLNIDEVIDHSLKIKQQFIAADPYDNNIRKSLNFGHTIGHALEALSQKTGKNPMLHGEAVAAGMLMETYLSHRKSGLKLTVLNELIVFYKKFFSPVKLAEFSMDELLILMKNDKKNENGKICFTLLREVGDAILEQEVSPKEIKQAFEFYRHATA
jgi:3-dehydroquinate synthase